jgi:hypothetical protein
MQAQDFIIEDDGVEQAVHLDEAADAEPISLVIAVQCGRRAEREFGRMAGLAAMLDLVLSGRQNEAALLLFDSKRNLVQDFTNQADVIETDLKNLRPGDHGAAILDAVAYSAKMLAKRPAGRQRVLLLTSETRDHGSHFAKIDDAVKVGRSYSHYGLRAAVFAIYFSATGYRAGEQQRRAEPELRYRREACCRATGDEKEWREGTRLDDGR